MKSLLLISRPRFWVYLLGPFAIGVIASVESAQMLLDPLLLYAALFFTFPANLFIYGVNDLFDYETDAVNAKKQTYEVRVDRSDHVRLKRAIAWSVLPFVPLFFLLPTSAVAALTAFFFFGYFYSATPIRAKARPFLDSAYNILYICPALVGWFLVSEVAPPFELVFAACLWAMAMHAYSAVPDIEADRAVKLRTIATALGFTRTLVLCGLLYVAAGGLFALHHPIFAVVFAGVYVALMIASFVKGSGGIFAVYRVFPFVNTVIGAILFFLAAAKLF